MDTALRVDSKITAVTVFRRGAMITRSAEIEAHGDSYPDAITLIGLPLTLDDSTVRLEVEGEDAGVLPVAGDVRVTVSVPEENPRLPPPDDSELDEAQLGHAKAKMVVDGLRSAMERVQRLEIVARGQPEEGKPPAPSPTGARLELLAFRRQRALLLHAQLQEAQAELHVATERVETLRERRRVASGDRNARRFEIRKAAIVRLEWPGDGAVPPRVRLHLRYFVPGARWAPTYTVRLDRGLRAGRVELRALLGQATGEDWQGVALTLSTATPQQWTELPELRALRIGRAQPEPAKTGWRPPPVGAGELYRDYDRDLGRPPRSSPPRPLAGPAAPTSTAQTAEPEAAVLQKAKRVERPEPVRSRSAAPFTGAPPPAPQAPPAPTAGSVDMPVPMPMSAARRSGGFGAVLGNAMGATVGGIASAFGGGGPGEDLDDGAADFVRSQVVAARDLLDYGRLQLHGADDSRRGALRRVAARVSYRRLSVETLEVDLAFEQIGAAAASARELESRDPPPSHHDPHGQGGFDYAYVADAPIDLSSDGRYHAVPVLAAALKAHPRYVSVPRETQDVFRVVAVLNPLDAPMLPGPADVYVDGRFAITSDVELTPEGGRIELGLGVEQAIKIARNVDFDEDSSGLMRRQHDLGHTIRIEVANHLADSATVEIRERVPVVARGAEGDVQIEEREVDPPWDEYEQKLEPLEGGRVWHVDVPAGEKRELRARWVASVSSNHELVGGNRREG